MILFSTIKLILWQHQPHPRVWEEEKIPHTEPHERRLQYWKHFRWVGPFIAICGQQIKHHFHAIFHCFAFPATQPNPKISSCSTQQFIIMNREDNKSKPSNLFWKGHYQTIICWFREKISDKQLKCSRKRKHWLNFIKDGPRNNNVIRQKKEISLECIRLPKHSSFKYSTDLWSTS